MRALIVCLALLQLCLPLFHVAAGDSRINAFLTNDDTYYYLQTAWNARHLGFVTFDGINSTNGVQFLWFSILYGLAFLVPDKSAFLAVASTVAIVLSCVPYYVMWAFAGGSRESRTSIAAVFMALIWALVCAYRPDQYLSGLESPLHAAIVWLILFRYLKIRGDLRAGIVGSGSILLFVLLLVLNTWTRLDSFGLSASFLVLLLLTLNGALHPAPARLQDASARTLPVSTSLAAGCVITAGAAVLFAFFQRAGGSWMPVSALVKGYHVDRFSLGAFYNWSLVLFPLRIQGANLLNILGIVAMFASIWHLLRMRVTAADFELQGFRLAALTLASGVLIHSIVTFGMFRYYYFWYLSASFTYWTITLALFSVELVERKRWNERVIVAGVSAIVVTAVGLWWFREPPNNLADTRYAAGKWIDANLERDAVLGSFNAGQLGYFSNRSVVNLDGLINNVSYFENVLQDESPERLAAYMDRMGIDYVADHLLGRFRGLEGQFLSLQEFQLASGGAVKIMKRVSRALPPERARSSAAATGRSAGR